MKIEVSFSSVEVGLLQQILTDDAPALQAWDIESLPALVHLLAMHGADHAGDLLRREDDYQELTTESILIV